MSFTLRQVQPLLTKPELELFQASRATAVKDIAPHRLASKIQRARALRDKYRDVYQRQTVQTRTGAPKTRQPLGGENTRTQTKGEIMDEVLKRFEAQQDKLQRQSDKAPAAPSAQRATRAKPATRKTASTPRQKARQTRAAQKAGEDVVQARSTAAKTGARTPVAKTPAKKTPAKKAPVKKPAAKNSAVSVSALASGVKRLQNIVKAVRKAVAADTKTRSKKPVTTAKTGTPASDAALSSAPTDITPKAERVNLLKAKPVNKKIHAAARSRTRATQAKRDAR